MLKGKCMTLFEVVDTHIDDYTTVLNGQKKNSSGEKRNNSAHRLLAAIATAAPSFLPCVLRKELLTVSSVKALTKSVLVNNVIDGQLNNEARVMIPEKCF